MDSLYGAATSPDTSSTVFPGRAIKPLPQRSLRARLPDDTVSGIAFPPAPITNFSFPYDYAGQTRLLRENGDVHGGLPSLAVRTTIQGQRDLDTGEDTRTRSAAAPVQSGHIARTVPASSYSQGRYLDVNSRHSVTGSISATSSADSYESFENTNNKKRKIPTPSNPGHHSHLSNELANFNISSVEDGVQDGYGMPSHLVSSYGYASSARRGYARHSSGRSPLAVSTNGSNWSSARRRINWSGSLSPPPKSGDFSDLLDTPVKSSRSAPNTPESSARLTPLDKSKTQFTFTYETSVPTNMMAPLSHSLPPLNSDDYPYDDHTSNRGMPLPSRPISEPLTSIPRPYRYADRYSPNPNEMPPASQEPPPQTHRKLRSKRAAREAASAARQRRLQENLNSSQNPQDFWICEFCEYESIFGGPPEALVRQYEIKDRRERKRLAEQKRLLEKAKMKGRKGRKASKAAKAAQNNATQSQQQVNNQGAQDYGQEYPRRPHPPRMDSQTTQSDEFEDEEYLSETAPAEEALSAPPPLAIREKPAKYDPNYVRKKSQGQANLPSVGVTT